MAEHNETGAKGEAIAATYLIKKGFKVLHTNWRNRKDEIDIIAKKDDFLVMVEVKTRSGNYFGEPEVFVNKNKQRNLIRAAQAYAERYSSEEEIRFDIVGVIIPNNAKVQVNHIEHAFYPTL